MQIFALSGSLRTQSATSALVRATSELAPAGVDIVVYDELDRLPPFNPDLDGESPPPAVVRMRAALAAADAVLLCTPEYIHGMPGNLKNALDWTASSGEFVNKPVGVISASPSPLGGDRAHAALVHTLEVLSAEIVEGATLIVPRVRSKITEDGHVSDESTRQCLFGLVEALKRFVTIGLTNVSV